MCICSFSLRKKDVRHADGEGLDLLGHLIFVWGLFYLCSDSCWELRNSCQLFLSKHLKFKVCSEYLKFQSLYNKYVKLRQSEPYSTWKTINSNCEKQSTVIVKLLVQHLSKKVQLWTLTMWPSLCMLLSYAIYFSWNIFL